MLESRLLKPTETDDPQTELTLFSGSLAGSVHQWTDTWISPNFSLDEHQFREGEKTAERQERHWERPQPTPLSGRKPRLPVNIHRVIRLRCLSRRLPGRPSSVDELAAVLMLPPRAVTGLEGGGEAA